VPGPLSDRIAQRHNRSTSPISASARDQGPESAEDEHNSRGILAS
jgi:hypothetical protein